MYNNFSLTISESTWVIVSYFEEIFSKTGRVSPYDPSKIESTNSTSKDWCRANQKCKIAAIWSDFSGGARTHIRFMAPATSAAGPANRFRPIS